MSNFIWYDLMTPDMKASSEFYAHVVGWTIKDSGMPGMTYSVLSANGIDVGGIMPIPPSSRACRRAGTATSIPLMWTRMQTRRELGGKIYQPRHGYSRCRTLCRVG